MGKQARGKARTRNGTPQPRPRMHDWRGQPTRAARALERELTALWLSDAESSPGLPYYAPALILHREDWPRSAAGRGELDAILDEIWR